MACIDLFSETGVNIVKSIIVCLSVVAFCGWGESRQVFVNNADAVTKVIDGVIAPAGDIPAVNADASDWSNFITAAGEIPTAEHAPQVAI